VWNRQFSKERFSKIKPMPIVKKHHGPIEYVLKGQNPKLLIISGMHGNEFEVIECVKEFIYSNEKAFPDFLYIPNVSPSAVTRKTRTNMYNHDINRSFFSPPPDPEVASCIKILSQFSFDACLDFHEDPDRTREFYLYDTGVLHMPELQQLRSEVTKSGCTLYSGLDDPTDTTLGYYIVDGYVTISIDLSEPDTGFSSGWLLRHKVVKRSYTLEIPGKSDVSLKKALVSTLFSFFLPTMS
jgi:hypothetical protein